MKKAVNLIASFILVRVLVKLIVSISTKIMGLASIFKYRAQVPKASYSSSCRWDVLVKYGENITVGDNTRIGPKSVLGAKGTITIGKNVVISRGVQLETAGLDLEKGPPYWYHKAKPIVIEDDCWIGSGAIVLGGVTVGRGSIIGAGAVLSKSVPPGSIIVSARVRNLKEDK